MLHDHLTRRHHACTRLEGGISDCQRTATKVLVVRCPQGAFLDGEAALIGVRSGQDQRAVAGFPHVADTCETAGDRNHVAFGVHGAALGLDGEVRTNERIHVELQRSADEIRVHLRCAKLRSGVIGAAGVNVRDGRGLGRRIFQSAAVHDGRTGRHAVKRHRRKCQVSANAEILAIAGRNYRDLVEEVGVVDRTDKMFRTADAVRDAAEEEWA